MGSAMIINKTININMPVNIVDEIEGENPYSINEVAHTRKVIIGTEYIKLLYAVFFHFFLLGLLLLILFIIEEIRNAINAAGMIKIVKMITVHSYLELLFRPDLYNKRREIIIGYGKV